MFQIELAIRAATGRLSEWFGELSVPLDRFARTVGFHRIGEAEAERWTPRSRAMMERFVAGARAWIGTMPAPALEHALLAVPAELPEELGPWGSAFAYVAWGLSGNWDHELVRVLLIERFGAETANALLPPVPPGPPDLVAGSLAGRLLDGLPRSRGQGSNNWAVAGGRTASGKPLLANDPHLLVQQPAAWFEIHLRAPGYEARGAAFPFAPGVAIGMTEHHAWGFTNVSGDVQDLYVERIDEGRTAAEFDGAWEPLAVRTETIEVRGGDPVTFEVAHTRHGPIIDAAPVGVVGGRFEPIGQTYALAWTGADGLLEPASLIDLASAGSFEDAREALRTLGCPGQNVIYADVGGTIGFQCTGRYPIRRRGDGTVPVPGWTSDHGWDGFVPFDDLPWSKDPGSGFLATANNRTWDEDYPFLIGLDVHTRFRARRIADVLRAGEGLEVARHGAAAGRHALAPRTPAGAAACWRRRPPRSGANRCSNAFGVGTETCEPDRPPRPSIRSGWAGSRRSRSARPPTCSRATSRGGSRSCARRCRRCSRSGSRRPRAAPGRSSSRPRWTKPWTSSRSGWARTRRPGDGGRSTGSGSRTRSRGSRAPARCSSPPSTSSAATNRPSCRPGSTPISGTRPSWSPRGASSPTSATRIARRRS